MVQHSSVPTTCTASLLTGWDYSGIGSVDPKTQVNARMKLVNELIKGGYKEDFAILHAFTTKLQNDSHSLDDVMPRLGFEMVFHGMKSDDRGKQRHQETGDLFLWAVKPSVFKEKLTAYKHELVDLKEKIDPPKKPDPKRLALPDLKLSWLRKQCIVHDNSSQDNSISEILVVAPDKAALKIKMNFGMDVKSLKSDWRGMSVRQLKKQHEAWKNELF